MRLAILVFATFITLAGCGKKGPLVLPTSQYAAHSTLSS